MRNVEFYLYRSIIFLLIFIASVNVYAQESGDDVWTLRECIDYALENSLNIERNRLNVQGGKVNLKQAKMNMLPSANVNGSYGINWGRSINPTTNLFVTERINFSSAGVNSSVILFNWFNLRNNLKQAQVDLEASKYDLEKAENDIILDVITFYTNVIFQQELVENAKLQLNSTRQQLERTRKQVEAGALPKTNLLDLQSQEASNELTLVNAENNLDFAVLQLKQVLQIPANQPFEIEIPQLEVDDDLVINKSENEVYQEALATMPEIKSSNLQVESAAIDREIAESSLYPTLRLNGGISTNYSNAVTERFIPDGGFTTVDSDGDNIPDTEPIGFVQTTGDLVVQPVLQPTGTFEDFGFIQQFEENRSTFVSLSLSIPIFNGLQARSNMQRATINNKQAQINAEQARQNLRQIIETAYNDVMAASKAYSQSVKQVEALEESFRMTQTRYNLQAVSFVDFQVASNNLFQARSDLLRAKYDYIFKQKILDFYLGKPLTFN